MRVTDAERTARLRALATAALRKNQPRVYQMPWDEIVYSGLHNSAEQRFAAAATPALVLRLLNRLERQP